jgi:sugar phosphate isomerase/epimerase
VDQLAVISDGVDKDFAKALGVIRMSGLRHVEIQSVDGFNVGDPQFPSAARLKAALRQEELAVCCLTSNVFGGRDIRSTTTRDRNYIQDVRMLERTLELAAELDVPVVRVMSFSRVAPLFGAQGAETTIVVRDAWDRLYSLLQTPVRLATDAGIGLVVETSSKGMVYSAALARRLVDRFEGAALKALWDPGNALMVGEDPLTGYESLGAKRIGHIHIKDLIVNIPASFVECRRLGEGTLGPNLLAIASRLANDGYSGAISLENIFCPPGASLADGFMASATAFQTLFGGAPRVALRDEPYTPTK